MPALEMSSTRRRELLKAAAAAMGSTWVVGCNEQRAAVAIDAVAGHAAGVALPRGGGAATPVHAATTVKYRNAQRHLFQTVSAATIPPRLPQSGGFPWDRFGPTHVYVDFATGWAWKRLGGDWIDHDELRYGPRPWFSIDVEKPPGNSSEASYSADVTSAMKFVQAESRWNAFLLTSVNAARTMAGPFHERHIGPRIEVTYANGKSTTLACRIVAVDSKSSTGPVTTSAEIPLPAFVEFERPEAKVTSARLHLTITKHWSGAHPRLDGFLLDPPLTPDADPDGLAARTGRLDQDIAKNVEVIGSHRYVDGTALADFVYSGTPTYTSERYYDPAIFGTGPSDSSKFPHAGLGKWINIAPKSKLVDSRYTGEGFAPLAPGLGALRLSMPAEPGVHDGSMVGNYGTGASNAVILLPEPLFGRLGRIFVRYYFRLGAPYAATGKRLQVYNEPGSSDWTTMAGKFGVAPDHSTSYGGVSGSSGGGDGWQMRHAWYDCDAGTGGPDEGGWAAGFHLYDFYNKNPPGYNVGQNIAATQNWGQRGGLGGMLYAGHWYCVETELKLNSVSNTAPGFTPDGELRAWVDGHLVYESTGMVFRTLPLGVFPPNPDRIRPCRELGVRGLWLNWFHGGKTSATFDRTCFYTGIVWATGYIGPMKL